MPIRTPTKEPKTKMLTHPVTAGTAVILEKIKIGIWILKKNVNAFSETFRKLNVNINF